MITAQEACTIAQGACLKELKYIEDTIRTAVEMHMMSCIIEEEITEAEYIMALHKEYGCDFVRAKKAHDKALTYLRDTSTLKG